MNDSGMKIIKHLLANSRETRMDGRSCAFYFRFYCIDGNKCITIIIIIIIIIIVIIIIIIIVIIVNIVIVIIIIIVIITIVIIVIINIQLMGTKRKKMTHKNI